MKKLYQKKGASTEESNSLQLQRRHTIIEGENEEAFADKAKLATRSNSVSSLDRTQSASAGVDAQSKSAEKTLSPDSSNYSNASTVVITESELSSSWLYKNKKAQMNNTESIQSTCDSSAQLEPSCKDEAKSPILPKSNPKSKRSRNGKITSCCCYASVIAIVCLSSLGILSAIGSILYMEFFANLNKTESEAPVHLADKMTESHHINDLHPMQKIGQLSGNNKNTNIIGHPISRDTTLSDKEGTKKTKYSIMFGKGQVGNTKIQTNSQNIKENIAIDEMKNKHNHSAEEELEFPQKVLDRVIGVDRINDQTINEGVSGTDNHPLNILLPKQNEESPYSKLFELYKDIHDRDSEFDKQFSTESDSFSIAPAITMKNDSDFVQLKEERQGRLPGLEWSFNSNSDIKDFDSDKDTVESNTENRAETLPPIPKIPLPENRHWDSSNSFRSLGDNSEPDGISEGHSSEEINPNVGWNFNSNLEDDLDSDKEKFDIDQNRNDVRSFPLIPEFLPLPPDNGQWKISNSFRFLGANSELDSVPKGQRFEDFNPAMAWNFNSNFKDFNRNNVENGKGSNHVSSPFIPNLSPLPTETGHFETSNFFRSLGTNSESDGLEEETFEDINPELDMSPNLNGPIVGANIAIPGPIQFMRRLNSEKGESNTMEPKVYTSELDRRFSLSEALERLRLLDANNAMPTSRRKRSTTVEPMPFQGENFGTKIQDNNEVGRERARYLKTLREKLYDE